MKSLMKYSLCANLRLCSHVVINSRQVSHIECFRMLEHVLKLRFSDGIICDV